MLRWIVLSSLVVWTLACASVEVVKVPHAPSYVLDDACDGEKDGLLCWNEMRERADSIKGARYYLPRPYVVVKQEFPVGGGSAFVSGKVDGQGKVLSIDPATIPKALQEFFPAGKLGAEKVKAPGEIPAAGGGARIQSASDGGTAPQTTASGTTAPTLKADDKNSLKDSTVSHSDVPSSTTVITLKVKVAKDALLGDAFGQGPVLDDKKVYLVPFTQGKHTTEGLVKVEKIVSVQGKAGEDRLIEAQVEGSKVPAHASLAVGVEGTVDGARKVFILHRSAVDLHNSFGGSSKPEAVEDKDPSQGDKQGDKKVSKAAATVSGDPTTEPLIKISDLYDVLLLPDFSEQYAIQVRSGVFQASADIGLENGWMAEKLNFDIDNSALGEFLLESATKILDAGLGKVFPVQAAVEQAQAQPSGTAQVQSKADSEVLLRIDFVEIAVPGLYPLVKAEEQECGFKDEKPKGIAPCPPRVDWRTRTEWVVTLVNATPAGMGGGGNCDITEIATSVETYANVGEITKEFKSSPTFSNAKMTPGGDLTLDVAKGDLKDADSLKDAQLTSFQEEIKKAVNKVLIGSSCAETVRAVAVTKK